MTVSEIRFMLRPAHFIIRDKDGTVVNENQRSLIFVTNKGIHIYVDTFNGPTEEYYSPLDDFYGDATTGWDATTDDGHVISFNRTVDDCMCGSRLRSHDPFRGVPHTNTYT